MKTNVNIKFNKSSSPSITSEKDNDSSDNMESDNEVEIKKT
jgi:hypothetical protein